jgi:hypothetical protein
MIPTVAGRVVDRAILDNCVIPAADDAMSLTLEMHPNSALTLTVTYRVSTVTLDRLARALRDASNAVTVVKEEPR